MARLAGKIAFITGAGTGIGRATSMLFAREGAKVAIADIDAPTGEETAHLAGNGAIAIRTDVTDPDSLQSAIRATVDKFGRFDVQRERPPREASGPVGNRRGAVFLLYSLHVGISAVFFLPVMPGPLSTSWPC